MSAAIYVPPLLYMAAWLTQGFVFNCSTCMLIATSHYGRRMNTCVNTFTEENLNTFRENLNTLREVYATVAFFTANPTWNILELNPVVQRKKPVTHPCGKVYTWSYTNLS
jgi:hypothetical protein